MRIFSFIALSALLLTACGTSKEATTKSPAGLSAADYPYIQKFHEGTRLKVKGQYTEAITAFQECVTAKPEDDAAAFALAQCYLLTNQRSQAVIYTEKAAKIDPKNIWYTQELAYMYFEEGKLDLAEKAFQKMVAAQTQNIDWLFGYAEVLKRLGKPQQAIDSYNKMQDQLGVIPDLSLQKYDLYVRMKQDEKALAELEKARAAYPDDPSLLGALVDHYFQRNNVTKAKDILLEMVRINPLNGQAHLALGDIYARENNRTEALKHFKSAFEDDAVKMEMKMNVLRTFYEQPGKPDQQVIDLAAMLPAKYPEDASAHSVYADMLLKAEREDEALKSYATALKKDDSNFSVWNQVLLMEYRLGKFEDLYRDARACSALFPTITNVQVLYVIACVKTNRYQEAIDGAEMGLSLVVNDKVTEAEFYAQMGEAYFKLKNPENGIRNFEKAMSLDEKNMVIKSNYALMLARFTTNYSEANSLIDQVLAQYPKEAVYIDAKGIILFREGKFAQAKTQFESAVQIVPTEGAFTEHLGDVYAKSGDAAKAVELWKQAKTLGAAGQTLDKKIQTKAYHDAE